MTMNDEIRCNSDSRLRILYHTTTDIDGFNCRREFSNLIQRTGQRFYRRAHEWCCGHGAIGYQLFEDGLCKHLVLTDKFPTAIQDCLYTRAANDLTHHVTIYQTERLDQIPKEEKWDLFVANLPWRCKIQPGPDLDDHLKRKMFDIDWQLHNHMWDTVSDYLAPNADIYLYEDNRFSNETTWAHGFLRAELHIENVYHNFGNCETGYVMHLKPNRKGP